MDIEEVPAGLFAWQLWAGTSGPRPVPGVGLVRRCGSAPRGLFLLLEALSLACLAVLPVALSADFAACLVRDGGSPASYSSMRQKLGLVPAFPG